MTLVYRIELAGDDALGLTLQSKSDRNLLAEVLRTSGVWLEVIPGTTGLTVQYDPLKMMPDAAKTVLERQLQTSSVTVQPLQETICIPVCYEDHYAIDMNFICRALNLPAPDIIARHTGTTYRMDMFGFTPGFAYLEGGDQALSMPRLDKPRQSLPAGSIGVTGTQCGLYALPGPGGWPVIGRTPMPLFDDTSGGTSRLKPGILVKFTPISSAEFEIWK